MNQPTQNMQQYEIPVAVGQVVNPPPVPTHTPMHTPVAGFWVGRQLKHFRVERLLAVGGMGEVYAGTDLSLNRPVAIKVIRADLAADTGFLTRFVREAQAQANIIHPNIVQVYFIGAEQGVYFMAMQLVDGGTLQEILGQRKTMRWQDAARAMLDLADGLREAARIGVIHRDIKPANILVDKKAGRHYLADFGLATVVGAKDEKLRAQQVASKERGEQNYQTMQLTQVGDVMGTPEYVAPEQVQALPLDERADIYSLAATFYHLLVGRSPIDARTLEESFAAYQGKPTIPLRRAVPQIPKSFAAIVDACLVRQREQRVQTFEQLVRLLRRALPQPEIVAQPLSRVLSWFVDVVPIIALGIFVYRFHDLILMFSVFALFTIFAAGGIAVLGCTPGQWLLRLRLRVVGDEEVSLGRGMVRFAIQHGWIAPMTLFLHGAYAATSYAELSGALAMLWLLVSFAGSVLILRKSPYRQSLHDRLTNTCVLVDVR